MLTSASEAANVFHNIIIIIAPALKTQTGRTVLLQHTRVHLQSVADNFSNCTETTGSACLQQLPNPAKPPGSVSTQASATSKRSLSAVPPSIHRQFATAELWLLAPAKGHVGTPDWSGVSSVVQQPLAAALTQFVSHARAKDQ